MTGTTDRRPVSVRALLIPADQTRTCQLLDLALTTATFSDAIGGGLLDEALTEAATGPTEPGYTFYADADRTTKQLPGNPRAVLLTAHLDRTRLADDINLHGDILITGTDPGGNDTHLPHTVINAAHHTRILPCACHP